MSGEVAPVLIMALLGVGAGVLLGFSHLLGRRSAAPEEAGEGAEKAPLRPLRVWFYRLALVFVVFEVMLVFLYPWAVVFGRGAQDRASLLLAGLAFAGLGALGLFYVWRKGLLEWQ